MKIKTNITALKKYLSLIPSEWKKLQMLFISSLIEKGQCRISNIIASKHTDEYLRYLKQTGTLINYHNDELIVYKDSFSRTIPPLKIEPYDNLLLPFLLMSRMLTNSPITLTHLNKSQCDKLHLVLDPLTQIGLKIHTSQNKTSCSFQGPLQGGVITMNYISGKYIALILSILPLTKKNSTITIKQSSDTHYIHSMLNLFQYLHINIHASTGYTRFHIKKEQNFPSFDCFLESDSPLAFIFLCISAAKNSDVTISNVETGYNEEFQNALSILKDMGYNIRIETRTLRNRSIHFFSPSKFHGNHISIKNISAIYIISIIAVACHGENKSVLKEISYDTDFYNALLILQKELPLLGVKIIINKHEIEIYPVSPSQKMELNGHNNSLVSIALIIVALASNHALVLSNITQDDPILSALILNLKKLHLIQEIFI